MTLSGEKVAVLDAPAADLIVVSALDETGLGLYLVRPGARGLSIEPYETIDSRLGAVIRFESSTSQRLSDRDMAGELDAILDSATIAVCSEALGAMQALLEATRTHLETRRQFGRRLADFQVLQHRLVDMFGAIEATEAAVEAGQAALPRPAEQRTVAVSACKHQTCRAARFVAQEAVQLHGAIGVTDELAVSHYFRRLMMIETQFGDANFHFERFRQATRKA